MRWWGRCNHESSCGYHYREAVLQIIPLFGPDWKDNFFRIPQPVVKTKLKKQLWTITTDIVKSTHSNPEIDSDFTLFLTSMIGRENTVNIVKEYHRRNQKQGRDFLRKPDTEGRCRTGKIMKYDRRTRETDQGNVGGRIAGFTPF